MICKPVCINKMLNSSKGKNYNTLYIQIKFFISTYIVVFLRAVMMLQLRYIVTCLLLFVCLHGAVAQVSWPNPEIENLYKQAREFHSQGNLRQAIIRYQQAIQIAPDIVLLHRELAHAYYLAQGYDDAIATLEPIIKQQQADAETYKIMAQSLVAINETKKAKKLLRDAINDIPNAGTLYHQAGLLHEADNEQVYALEAWLDGIQKDPAYHLNYYEAARMYMNTSKMVWAIIYGEIFINLEQQTKRSYDTRAMVLEAYKRLYTSVATGNVPKFGKTAGKGNKGFEEAVYSTYIQLAPVITDGITTENLTILRTRFLMDWTMQYADKYPFSLFTRYNQLVSNGYFDIYNQWMFGKTENQQQYDAWMKFHPEAMPRLQGWMNQYPYKPVPNEFYNEKTVDGIFEKKKAEDKR